MLRNDGDGGTSVWGANHEENKGDKAMAPSMKSRFCARKLSL